MNVDVTSQVGHCDFRFHFNCKTCQILIKDTQFMSGLTNKTYHTRSWDDLICKSSNVVDGVEYSLCGLIYVCETKGQLRIIMSGHRFEVNHGGNPLLYEHFNLLDHSILSFKVRILEKVYHPSNNPNLIAPLRRQREEYWIRELTLVKLKLNTNFLNHFPVTGDMFCKTWSFMTYSQDPSVKNIKFWKKSMINIFPIEDNAFLK